METGGIRLAADGLKRGRYLITKMSQKSPAESKNKEKTCVRIRIYEKHISKRLEIPCGAKKNHQLQIQK